MLEKANNIIITPLEGCIKGEKEAAKEICKRNGNRDKFSRAIYVCRVDIYFVRTAESADERFTDRPNDVDDDDDDDVWVSGRLSKRQLPVEQRLLALYADFSQRCTPSNRCV